jgi:hypothetical protein
VNRGSTATRLLLLAALAAAAVVLFLVLRDDGSGGGESTGTSTESAAKVIVVRDGKPVGGVQPLEARKGERVRFAVSSDVADEVHVHGYDLTKDVVVGRTVPFDFEASIDGAFEIELEQRHEQIAELTVQP